MRTAIETTNWKAIRFAWAALLVSALLGTAACAAAVAEDARLLADSLEPGHGPDYYWQEIENLGFEVTSVNYDDPDYVEYEIVRGDESYEVHIELDDERRARDIDVTPNAWLADETAAVIDEREEREDRYDDRDEIDGREARADGGGWFDDEPAMVTVAAGTRVLVKVTDTVSSKTASVGQQIDFEVLEPVTRGNDVLIPAGSAFTGTVTVAEKAERPQKPGRLGIDVHELSVRGERRDVEAKFAAKGKGSHQEDARDIGIGAAVGAIVGAIAEGGEGALAGLVLGGGGVFLATKGEDVELPAGTQLTLVLENAVDVPREW